MAQEVCCSIYGETAEKGDDIFYNIDDADQNQDPSVTPPTF